MRVCHNSWNHDKISLKSRIRTTKPSTPPSPDTYVWRHHLRRAESYSRKPHREVSLYCSHLSSHWKVAWRQQLLSPGRLGELGWRLKRASSEPAVSQQRASRVRRWAKASAPFKLNEGWKNRELIKAWHTKTGKNRNTKGWILVFNNIRCTHNTRGWKQQVKCEGKKCFTFAAAPWLN